MISRFATVALAAVMLLAAPPVSGQMTVRAGERVVTLDGAGYGKGNAKAPVWIVEFADFGCSYCEKFWRETLPVLDSLYVKKGHASWRFVPFTIGMFPNSEYAAKGAICANEQGKFFPMHDILYDRRKEWMKATDMRAQVVRYAVQLRLDPARFAACLKGAKAAQQLAANNAMARALFIRGTPTFFINGEAVPGAIPTDAFVAGMNAVLKEAQGRRSR